MVLPVGMEGTQSTHCEVSVPSGLESPCWEQADGAGGCQPPVCMVMELWGWEEKPLEETSSLPTAVWVLGWEGAEPRVSCLSYSPFLCFIHMPPCLLGKISEQVGANTSFLCVGVTHALGPILRPFWIQWSHTHPCRQPGELVGPAQQGR